MHTRACQLLLPELGIDITFNSVDALRSWNELQHEMCMYGNVQRAWCYRSALVGPPRCRGLRVGAWVLVLRSESGEVDSSNYDRTFS